VPTCIGNFGPKRKQKKRWKIPGDRRDARALALGRCFCYFIYARCAAPRKCARLVQIQDQGALCELPIEDYSIFALQPLPSLSAHHHYHTIIHLQCRYLGDGRKRGLTRTRKKRESTLSLLGVSLRAVLVRDMQDGRCVHALASCTVSPFVLQRGATRNEKLSAQGWGCVRVIFFPLFEDSGEVGRSIFRCGEVLYSGFRSCWTAALVM
jgi:hypothetical protein